MSATPRTDAARNGIHAQMDITVLTREYEKLCRQLETELAAAQSRNAYLEQQVTEQHERAEKLCDRLAEIEKAVSLPDEPKWIEGFYLDLVKAESYRKLHAHALHLAAAQSRLAAIEKAAQLPELSAVYPRINDYVEALQDHALHLTDENARLREDAERYLYLRGLILFPTTMITVDDAFKDDPKLFDQAIDAARKEKA